MDIERHDVDEVFFRIVPDEDVSGEPLTTLGKRSKFSLKKKMLVVYR